MTDPSNKQERFLSKTISLIHLLESEKSISQIVEFKFISRKVKPEKKVTFLMSDSSNKKLVFAGFSQFICQKIPFHIHLLIPTQTFRFDSPPWMLHQILLCFTAGAQRGRFCVGKFYFYFWILISKLDIRSTNCWRHSFFFRWNSRKQKVKKKFLKRNNKKNNFGGFWVKQFFFRF